MNQSDVVKDLLHKLSKNEYLAQDGGNSRNQRYYNRTNQYRNQLNGLYGGGKEDDDTVNEIIKDIDQLIPLSVLQEYAQKVEEKFKNLATEKNSLEERIKELTESAASGNTTAATRISKLENELQKVNEKMSKLNEEILAKETVLKNATDELSNLRTKLQEIKTKTNTVLHIASTSDPVRALIEKLKGTS